jgi:peptidoglycan/xylan/chitin deacetylase (PgdA/CDA1 family)
VANQVALSFHGIGKPPGHVDPAEREYWVSPRLFSRLVEDSERAATEAGFELLVTFDDGNRSDLEIAAPLLAGRGIAAAFFPCTSRLTHPDYLSPNDLRTLSDDGFTIGSHGIDHVMWTKVGHEAAEREMRESKAQLEGILGMPVTSAAIPFGSYNRRVLRGMRLAGYRTAYCSDEGLADTRAWLRPRLTFRAGDDGLDVGALVSRLRSTAFRLRSGAKTRAKRWRP